MYTPSAYLKDKSELEAERKDRGFDQGTREHYLTAMLRVNLLKRLESSAHSFALTLGRILDKIRDIESRIDAWQQKDTGASVLELDAEEDAEDEEFVVGKARPYRFDELDVEAWAADLRQDRHTFERLHALAAQVDATRDAKLAELKRLVAEKVRAAPADKDGRANRKVLVFTTFADTARYLYENTAEWAQAELGAHIALVTGGSGNKATLGAPTFDDILGHFAPAAQQWPEGTEHIDILIATDCLSEGQNLQDCDLTVNYDIHWNPVRLMQRFGRIDRLGSRNQQVGMVNFWPTENLDRYLDLKNRVEARMALADATATGLDDPLAPEAQEPVQMELQFRDDQLRRLREESLDMEDADDGVNLNDLTLDDFIADLLNYIQQHREALEAAPFGICAVVDSDEVHGDQEQSAVAEPGVIFCLKQKATADQRTPNRLQPYFLCYVRNDGAVRFTFRQAKQTLSLFHALASGVDKPNTLLEDAFSAQTQQRTDMAHYEQLLAKAIRSTASKFGDALLKNLGERRDAVLPKGSEQPTSASDFELVTWLVLTTAS